MNNPTLNIEELVEKAKAFDRLQSIATRRNATGRYVATITPESILAQMEKKQDEEDAAIAHSRAFRAVQQAKADAEMAACSLFLLEEKVTFDFNGRVTAGKVVGFVTEGLLAPALDVWTGSIAQKATGRPLAVKPLKDKVNGLRTFMDGDQWCCVDGTFANLQESPSGFGDTEAKAVEAYRESLLQVTS